LKRPGKNNTPRLALYTLGCKVNQFESDCLVDQFKARGFEAVSFKDKADIYIINTCAVTHEAQRQSAQMVRQTVRNHPKAVILAAGCAAQLFPEDYQKISGLDYLAGTFGKLDIPFRIPSPEKKSCPELLHQGEPEHIITPQFPLPDQRTRGLLRIQEGCNAACSYCLVPRARGRSRSLRVDEVRSGVEGLAGQGIRELMVTGIHLGLYGEDLSPRDSLASLLKALLPRYPEVYFRLSSLEPQEVTPELIQLFQKYPNLCPHLHIPLQAGEDSLLRKMNRTYSTEFYQSLIQTIDLELPYAAIGTDLIVGFPGEEDVLFQKTLDFIQALPLSYLHIFPYSSRPGTPAADFPNPIPVKIKKDRLRILRELDRQKRESFMNRSLGQTFSALVLKSDGIKGWVTALTENYLTVSIPGEFPQNQRIQIRLSSLEKGGGLIGLPCLNRDSAPFE
jgi:threonylcarbamoyladenosine tRNA methylthiotransferase MtaB